MLEKYLTDEKKVYKAMIALETVQVQVQPKKEEPKTIFEALKNGLTPRQETVYNELKRIKPHGITAKELALDLHNRGLVSSPDRNSVHPRLKELVDMGLVKVTGKKICRYTDRSVSVYKYSK